LERITCWTATITSAAGPDSAGATVQTAEIMLRFEPVLADARADLVVVVGDVNSMLAGVLTASKVSLRLAHVGAGLRSFDRTMREEVNRVLTDSISDFLFKEGTVLCAPDEEALYAIAIRTARAREGFRHIHRQYLDEILRG
jgi:UDP-N-acetylglucosamine 2-epimerase